MTCVQTYFHLNWRLLIFTAGYYGGQPQGAPPGVQGGYGFPGYNYGGQQSNPSSNSQDQ